MTMKLHRHPASKMKMNRQMSSKWLISGTGSNWSQWQLMSRKSSSSKKPHNFQRSIIAECRNRYSSSHGQMMASVICSSAVQFVSLQEWWMLTSFIFNEASVGALRCFSLGRLKLSDPFTCSYTVPYTQRARNDSRGLRESGELRCADLSPRNCQHFFVRSYIYSLQLQPRKMYVYE